MQPGKGRKTESKRSQIKWCKLAGGVKKNGRKTSTPVIEYKQ